ncbi:MAG: hypothetical protein P8Y62_06740, partial [candidate division WOR-3 bacterium]
MSKKVVLLLMFVSVTVWCQSASPGVVEDAFWHSRRSIEVITPNGGEEWQVDSTYKISWKSKGWINFVKIEYTTDNDSTWNFITHRTRNRGFFFWEIPDTPSNYCKVRVSALYGTVSDESDSVFSIMSDSTPPDSSYIIITQPNGGETWYGDSVNYITWDSYETSGAVKIEYTLNAYDSVEGDSNPNWITITDDTVDVGFFAWFTPSDIYSNNCLIRVTDTDGSPSDISDEPFSIIPEDSIPPDTTPYLRVETPDGGETWYTNSTYYISWTSRNTSGTMKIEYTVNAYDSLGMEPITDWTTITDSTTDSSFAWLIPSGINSDEFLIRITDVDGSPSDVSDETFSIIPEDSVPPDSLPYIKITEPHGGETWYTDSVNYIVWDSYSTVGYGYAV